MDRRREVNRGPKVRRTDPTKYGFIEEGSQILGNYRLYYKTDNGFIFESKVKSYVGRVIECEELGLRQVFAIGTSWELIAAWIDEAVERQKEEIE